MEILKRKDIAMPARRLIVALAFLGTLGATGGGWHFSNMLVQPSEDRPLETPVVEAVDDSSIVLRDTRLGRSRGVWYLQWNGGSGIAGETVALGPTGVTRKFRYIGHLVPGDRVALRAYPYSSDPFSECGISFQRVSVDARAGSFPAWYMEGPLSTCVVFVHGRTATRAEALRMLPIVHSLGMRSLAITYRNDRDAPRAPDGLYHLGATEWEDLEAGVRFAIARGSRRVVLAGWSMGGAVIGEFMRRSALADSVGGIVLDAPVLDWSAVVHLGAMNAGGAARVLAPVAKAIVSLRTGFRWSDSGPRAWPLQFAHHVPVLLFHGTADDVAPIATSEAFASAFGERVTLVRTEDAGHVQSWNVDPGRYERALRTWLMTFAGEASGASSVSTLPAEVLAAETRRPARAEPGR